MQILISGGISFYTLPPVILMLRLIDIEHFKKKQVFTFMIF